MQSLEEQGADIFLEIGPNGHLLALGKRCVSTKKGSWIPSMRENGDDSRTLLHGVAQLYTQGVDFDWKGIHKALPRRTVSLPTYSFQRKSCWYATGNTAATETATPERPSTPPDRPSIRDTLLS